MRVSARQKTLRVPLIGLMGLILVCVAAQPATALAPQEPEEQEQQAGETTEQEREALELIQRILREEEGVLMGRDFAYDPSGRRDPFLSLLVTGPPLNMIRPPGLPGFLISEVELKGVAQFQGRWAALLIGPDQKSYFGEVGTEFFDGHIVNIDTERVVFEQQVPDLTGARRIRQVEKRLRNTGAS